MENSAFNSSAPQVFKTSTRHQGSKQKAMPFAHYVTVITYQGWTGNNSVELQYVHKNAVELIKILLPSLPWFPPSLQLFASCTCMPRQANSI